MKFIYYLRSYIIVFFINFIQWNLYSKDINKTLVIATEATYPPFVYINEQGNIIGIDIEIIDKVCKNLKYKYKVIHRPFETLFLGLQAKNFDIVIGGIASNTEREKKASFSISYYTDPLILIYHKRLNISLNKTKIKDKKIGVQIGTIFENYLKNKFNNSVIIKSYVSNNEAFLDFQNGRLDGVLADGSIIYYWLKNINKNEKMNYSTIIVNDKKYQSQLAMAFNKENMHLLKEVDKVLRDLKKDNTLTNIFSKYLENSSSKHYLNYFKLILKGIPVTILVAVLSLLLGIILTIIFVGLNLLKLNLLNTLITHFLMIIRALPEIVIILFSFYLLPKILTNILKFEFKISPIVISSLSLSIIFASYATNIILKQLKNFPKEQINAAKVLGLKNFQIFRRITFPQIFTNILPSLNNLWLILLKDTSIVALVGLAEIMNNTKLASNSTNKHFTFYLFAALVYLILTSLFNIGFFLINKIKKR